MYKKWGKSFCSEFSLQIKPFAASHSPPCWRAKVALGQDKQKADIVLNGDFLCLIPVRLLLSSMAVLYHVNG